MDARLPFPVSPVSNGEWCPLPVTRRQRLAARLIGEESDKRARRLGLTRAEFLCSAAGTATAFMVLNLVHGLDSSGDAAVLPVKREHSGPCWLRFRCQLLRRTRTRACAK